MMEGPNRHIKAEDLPVQEFVDPRLHLRQVGWLIAGGPHDGEFVPWPEEPRTKYPSTAEKPSMGSYSPVYMEIEND